MRTNVIHTYSTHRIANLWNREPTIIVTSQKINTLASYVDHFMLNFEGPEDIEDIEK